MGTIDKTKVILDGGTLDERITEMKDFFGLQPNQSFQDLDVEPIDDED